MLPVIFSSFNENQIRFYKITAEIQPADDRPLRTVITDEKSGETTEHDVRSSLTKKSKIKYSISALPQHIARHTRERIGIPIPDFAEAVSYDPRYIQKMLQRNPESFEGYWTTLPIPDALGRMQDTIILFEEAIIGITMKLQETRLKNPVVRESVIQFKRWVMELVSAIRRGKLRPVRFFNKIEDGLSEYFEALSYEGHARSDKVKEVAEKDGVCLQQVYRRLRVINGGKNLPTKKGDPTKSPPTKGSHKMPSEVQKIIDTYLTDPCLSNKDIWKRSGTKYSYGHVNAILRKHMGKRTF